MLVLALVHPQWRTTQPAIMLYVVVATPVVYFLCRQIILIMIDFLRLLIRYLPTLIRRRLRKAKFLEFPYVSHRGAEWGKAESLEGHGDGMQEWAEGWDDGRRSAEREAQRIAEQRAGERLAVGVMTREYEKSLNASILALFAALLIVGVYAVMSRDRGLLIVAAVTAIFFLLALIRQTLLTWRTSKGYFGSSEHEVRELLAFAMRHPTPDDFFDDEGNLLTAFDLRPREERTSRAVGEPIAGAT
jgi:hypothetical protein